MSLWNEKARSRAMAAHPAGKALASHDERQARMDAEACRVGSLNWRVNEAHRVSTGPRRRWLEIAAPLLTTVSVVGFLFADVFILNPAAIA